MASYTYSLDAVKQADLAPLQAQAVNAGLPVTDIAGSPGTNQIIVNTSRDLTGGEQTTLAGLVAVYDGRPRRARKPFDIYNDIAALTTTQQGLIATDLLSGSPPKFTQDNGNDAADLLVTWGLAQTGLSNADKNLVKRIAAAIYARDNPKYLVNPSFDGSISISGDEAYTP